jgi:hypothetical protein
MFLPMKKAIDACGTTDYLYCIISPDASAAGREAGSKESASAFSGGAS